MKIRVRKIVRNENINLQNFVLIHFVRKQGFMKWLSFSVRPDKQKFGKVFKPISQRLCGTNILFEIFLFC